MPLPAHIQPAVGERVGLDIAIDQPARDRVLLQHDLLALERKRQLRSDIMLLTFAQDVAQLIRGEVQRPMRMPSKSVSSAFRPSSETKRFSTT